MVRTFRHSTCLVFLVALWLVAACGGREADGPVHPIAPAAGVRDADAEVSVAPLEPAEEPADEPDDDASAITVPEARPEIEGSIDVKGTIGTERYGDSPAPGERSYVVPRILLRTPTVSAGLDAALVTRYVKRHLRGMNTCFSAQPRRDESSGDLLLAFEIGADGRVTSSDAKGSDSLLARCLAAVIRTIEFTPPKSGSPVHVSYPIWLSPS